MTVFKKNEKALKFYRENGYNVDETSPGKQNKERKKERKKERN